jgi:membrane-associated protein
LARFIPIVRTFAPFVAGVGKMNYIHFWIYNAAGAALWVLGLCFLGYFFGTIPIVKKNFTIVILAIVAISILPMVIEIWKAKFNKGTSSAGEIDPAA